MKRDIKLKFGKYKNTDPYDLIGVDEKYIFWMLTEGKKYMNGETWHYLATDVANECLMPVGKFKGDKIGDVRKEHRIYLDWMAKNTPLFWV